MTFTNRSYRPAAVVVGAFVGLAGAVSAVTPASASTAELTGAASCTDTGWKVGWRLTTTGTEGADGVFSNVTANVTDYILPPGRPGQSPTAPRLPALTTFVDDAKVTGDGVLTDGQAFIFDIRAVELKLTVTWNYGARTIRRDVRATAKAPNDCVIVNPTGSGTPPGEQPPPLDDTDTDVPSPVVIPPNEASPSQDPTDIGAQEPDPVATDAPAVPSSSPTPTQSPTGGDDGVATGSGGGDDRSGGMLALTGAAAGTIAGGSALLLAVGTALVVAARRRRTKFTA